MRVSPLVYAAEVEQAATASAVEDQALNAGSPRHAARHVVIDRYGVAGDDLIFDYQNDQGVCDRRTPPFVVFH